MRTTGSPSQWLSALGPLLRPANSRSKVEPRIAWYPSAQADYRDLLFLSEAYATAHGLMGLPSPPDLFLHTDMDAAMLRTLEPGARLFQDARTTIIVETCQAFESFAHSMVTPGLVNIEMDSKLLGQAKSCMLRVISSELGEWHVPLVYVCTENTAFASQILLPAKAKVSHLVRVRYGFGFGGSDATSRWLDHVLAPLGTEMLVTDQASNQDWQRGDDIATAMLPGAAVDAPPPTRTLLHKVPSSSWSDHGDVSWFGLTIPAGG